jgi:CDGSH-type Zn-finger protein
MPEIKERMDTPRIVQKQPFVIDEPPGKKAWCKCGLSARQPYCDGSHKTTACKPIVVEITEGKKVAWCGCKHSGNMPYCDGTHRNL